MMCIVVARIVVAVHAGKGAANAQARFLCHQRTYDCLERLVKRSTFCQLTLVQCWIGGCCAHDAVFFVVVAICQRDCFFHPGVLNDLLRITDFDISSRHIYMVYIG